MGSAAKPTSLCELENPVANKHFSTPVVECTGPHDLKRPENWSPARKWTIVAVNSLATFVVSFSASVFTGAIPQVQEEFNVSANVSLLGICLYVFGFAFGPMIWGPASELYGKRRPLWAGYAGFCVFQVVTALSRSVTLLLVARFLAAIAGSSPLAILSGMFIEILTDPTSRGIATACFAMAVFCGPVAGPIVGNIVAAHLGWRWTAWVTLICGVVVGVAGYSITPETSARIMLQTATRELDNKTRIGVADNYKQQDKPSMAIFVNKYLTKPLRMFALEPILVIFTVYMSLVYGVIYMTFTLYPRAFGVVRGWSPVDASLPFLAIFAGIVLACVALGAHSIYHVGPRYAGTKQHVPEIRLQPMILGSVVLPIGIFWFSWTSSVEINALAQAFSGVLIGGGAILTFMSGIIYLSEVYLEHANSALAINNFIRSATAAAFPYLAKALFARLGINIGGSVLGGICLALMPSPIILWKFGHIIRGWSKFAFQ